MSAVIVEICSIIFKQEEYVLAESPVDKVYLYSTPESHVLWHCLAEGACLSRQVLPPAAQTECGGHVIRMVSRPSLSGNIGGHLYYIFIWIIFLHGVHRLLQPELQDIQEAAGGLKAHPWANRADGLRPGGEPPPRPVRQAADAALRGQPAGGPEGEGGRHALGEHCPGDLCPPWR